MSGDSDFVVSNGESRTVGRGCLTKTYTPGVTEALHFTNKAGDRVVDYSDVLGRDAERVELGLEEVLFK